MPISNKRAHAGAGSARAIRILGIDPGYASMGYAVIEGTQGTYTCLACDVIESSSREALSERLKKISLKTFDICNRFKPELIAIEKLFFFKNQKTAIDVAQARGAILATTAQFKAAIVEYTPLQVKQSVTGNGHATKAQVAKMASLLFKGARLPSDDNALDALAIALAAAFHHKLR